jgi:hypothetical protein
MGFGKGETKHQIMQYRNGTITPASSLPLRPPTSAKCGRCKEKLNSNYKYQGAMYLAISGATEISFFA